MRGFVAAVLILAAAAACSDTVRSEPIDASIDAPIDAANPCSACTASQICVARYDGVCRDLGATCVARTVDCPGNTCSTACETAYCGSPLQCQNRAPCGGEPAGAFTCYGP